MLIPIGMNITLEAAPREKLGSYMGIMGAMTTLGPSSSVILAGVILAFADWHMLLWVFGGLSLLCFLSGAILLRDIAHLTHPRLDALSVAFIGIALIGVLYGVSTIFVADVLIATGSIVVGVIFGVLFVRRQGKLEEPLINLRPLGVPAFAIGTIVNMLSLIAIFAMNIIVPTYMQSVLGTDPLVASLILFPAILCSCAASPIAGRIYDRHGAGVLLPLGFACIAVFSVATAAFIATASPVVLAIIYVPVICGSALIIGPVQSFALSRLAPQENPHGITIMSAGFQVAGCIGSSVFTGVYALVGTMAASGGAAAAQAATDGMLATGIMVGVFAITGFCLALWIRAQGKRPVVVADVPNYDVAEAEQGATLVSIMKTDVYTVNPATSVAEALELFAAKGVSGMPVVDDDRRVVGFVSDGDVMSSLANQVPAFKTAWSFMVEQENTDFGTTVRETLALPVSAIATERVITVNVDDDLGEVARVLAEGHLKKAPVLRDGRMVGIINRSNITHYAIDCYLSRK